MCTVSMVFDRYQEPFRKWIPPAIEPVMPAIQWPAPQPVEVRELRQLIREFREAVAAARKVDVETKQPDCEDPGKAALEGRVAELERRLNALVEAVR